MKYSTKATNIELTVSIEDYLQKRLNSLDRFLPEREEDYRCAVEVGKSTNHHKSGDVFRAEVNLRMSGQEFYAVSEENDLYAAIDLVKDEIFHQITSRKTKNETLMRKSAAKLKNFIKGFDFRSGR